MDEMVGGAKQKKVSPNEFTKTYVNGMKANPHCSQGISPFRMTDYIAFHWR